MCFSEGLECIKVQARTIIIGSFPPWTGRVDFLIPHSVGELQKYQHVLFGKLVLAKVGFVGLSPQASVCSREGLQRM